MKFRAEKYVSVVVLAAFCAASNGYAYTYAGQLSPQNFNKMYSYAAAGRGDILREAVGRGLYIDTVNADGDTGLCIAVKRGDHEAYNAFRSAGANPRHACTFRMYQKYQDFLASGSVIPVDRATHVKAATYYWNQGHNWWPWILGAALVGGGVYALAGSGGGGKKHESSSGEGGGSVTPPNDGGGEVTPEPEEPIDTVGVGLGGYLRNYHKLISSGTAENKSSVDGKNSKSDSVVDSIEFLPNMLDNYTYLKAFAKVINGASFYNVKGGTIYLGDAAVGLASHGRNSFVSNDGSINIDARNGAIGMVASNGSQAVNGQGTGVSDSKSDDGTIRFIFKGSKEGDAAIGMYADTHASILNYGKIIGTTSMADVNESAGSSQNSGMLVDGDDMEDILVTPSNSGTLLGMSLFDFYNGTNLSANSVAARNYGNIVLQAGNNNASSVAISLIGMGSYLDDNFLNGRNNPAWAEKMILQNFGNIELSYQKSYNIASDALKLGTGGLIGMRADASTAATNQGNIKIDMQATNIKTGNDVATGMLSVHGASLVNGTVGNNYNGQGTNTGGTIRVINEATSGGVFYGMLAAKGSGAQTGLYKWQVPYLHNYGLIDMQASNSYAMASFAGGELVNDGVINLGAENGQSYYKNAKGLFAEGSDVAEEVSLINNGTINVYAEQSAAIYNAFSGSVTQTNNGSIYLSNKATKSKVFGGNYSTAINKGNILYKVGNSDDFIGAFGNQAEIGFNVKLNNDPVASVMTASGDNNSAKQYIVNEETGSITLGAVQDKNVDYGGTFGTAAIEVSRQGSADNKGTITIESYDKDIMQFNVGMWLNSTATAEAYANNYGNIFVNATNSIGMRNDSESYGSITNYGNIYANSPYSYGMAVSKSGANLFNGRYNNAAAFIDVSGRGAIGIYAKNGGNAFNYGTIHLSGDHTTAFQLDGIDSNVIVEGNITHDDNLTDITYFWMANGASYVFEHALYENPDAEDENERYLTEPYIIDDYILGKATQKGKAYFSENSIGYVNGKKARLFVAEDGGSEVYNRGKVEVSNGAIGMVAKNGAEAYNDMRTASLTVKDAESTGIYAVDAGSVAGTTVGSNLYVDDGTGLYAEGFSTADNMGNITVNKGIGMLVLDGSGSIYTVGKNSGNINVNSASAIGVKVSDGAQFTNNANINVAAGGQGIYSDSVFTNDHNGVITVKENSIGVYNDAGKATNYGSVYVSGANAIGIKGDAVSDGLIDVTGGIGVEGDMTAKGGELYVHSGVGVEGTLSNKGTVTVDNGVGVHGTLENDSTINVNGGIGVVGGGKNRSVISVLGGATGINVTSSFINSGTIEGSGVGVEVTGGSFTNQGTIKMYSGKGIWVKNGGSAVNQSIVEVGNGQGFYVENGGQGVNEATINLLGSGYGAYVANGGRFINNGIITYDSEQGGHCANIGVGGECQDDAEDKGEIASVNKLIKLEEGATFVNKGKVDLSGADVDFATDGKYVLGDGGVYTAESFSGEILASNDIVMNEQKDVYVQENAFEGKNNGLEIKSQSYMFDASVIDKEDKSDVVLERKGFDKLVDQEDLAEFLESNYQAQNGGKMYQALKSANDEQEFDRQLVSENGERFYANLPRENMAVLRGLENEEQKRILADGVNNVSVGAGYFRTGKNGVGNLSDYEDDVYSIYGSGGTRLNRNWSMGATLKAAYVDASYDDIHSQRENKIIMAFLPIMYQQNRFKFLTTPTLGVGLGKYERHTLANKYEADTFDIYYGMYNHAEYSVDMKVAELVAEAELNMQGMSMHADNEKGGLKLHDTDSVSLESGIGVKIRKRIQLAKEREIMLALGTKYYHEFLDLYENLTVGARGVSETYRLKGYDEDKNRLRTTAEAAYRDGNFTISAEVAHNVEKESNVEGNLGVRYNF